MTNVIDVPKLPVRTDLGFPHTIRLELDNIAYDVFLGFNSEDRELIMSFTRLSDERVVFLGRVPLHTIIRVYDPDTYERIFALYPMSIDADKQELDIWVFPKSLSTDADIDAVLGT